MRHGLSIQEPIKQGGGRVKQVGEMAKLRAVSQEGRPKLEQSLYGTSCSLRIYLDTSNLLYIVDDAIPAISIADSYLRPTCLPYLCLCAHHVEVHFPVVCVAHDQQRLPGAAIQQQKSSFGTHK